MGCCPNNLDSMKGIDFNTTKSSQTDAPKSEKKMSAEKSTTPEKTISELRDEAKALLDELPQSEKELVLAEVEGLSATTKEYWVKLLSAINEIK